VPFGIAEHESSVAWWGCRQGSNAT